MATSRIAYLIAQLGEEASEVSQETAKCLLFGLDEQCFEGTTYDAHERLQSELIDLFALVELLKKEGILQGLNVNSNSFIRAMTEKKLKVERLLLHSEGRGLLWE